MATDDKESCLSLAGLQSWNGLEVYGKGGLILLDQNKYDSICKRDKFIPNFIVNEMQYV